MPRNALFVELCVLAALAVFADANGITGISNTTPFRHDHQPLVNAKIPNTIAMNIDNTVCHERSCWEDLGGDGWSLCHSEKCKLASAWCRSIGWKLGSDQFPDRVGTVICVRPDWYRGGDCSPCDKWRLLVYLDGEGDYTPCSNLAAGSYYCGHTSCPGGDECDMPYGGSWHRGPLPEPPTPLPTFPPTPPPTTQPTQATCAAQQFSCDSGWVAVSRFSRRTNPTNERCCEATCATYHCSGGWVAVSSWASRTSPTDSQCCQETCALYECPLDYVRRNHASTTFDKQECCELCPRACRTCKDGTTSRWGGESTVGRAVGGKPLVFGRCTHYCSIDDYCGTGIGYYAAGTDCRSCTQENIAALEEKKDAAPTTIPEDSRNTDKVYRAKAENSVKLEGASVKITALVTTMAVSGEVGPIGYGAVAICGIAMGTIVVATLFLRRIAHDSAREPLLG